MARMIANPSPRTAFLVGVLVFSPSVTCIAAIQAIATAHASLELSAVALGLVVVLNVLLVWLPILAHLVAPGWTSRTLTGFNGWLRAHGRIIVPFAAAVAGARLTVPGLTGLLGGRDLAANLSPSAHPPRGWRVSSMCASVDSEDTDRRPAGPGGAELKERNGL
jgi:hypothetical protein